MLLTSIAEKVRGMTAEGDRPAGWSDGGPRAISHLWGKRACPAPSRASFQGNVPARMRSKSNCFKPCLQENFESEGGVLSFLQFPAVPFSFSETIFCLKLEATSSDSSSGNLGENESWLAVPVESPLTTTLLLLLFDDEPRKSLRTVVLRLSFLTPLPQECQPIRD